MLNKLIENPPHEGRGWSKVPLPHCKVASPFNAKPSSQTYVTVSPKTKGPSVGSLAPFSTVPGSAQTGISTICTYTVLHPLKPEDIMITQSWLS